jgi:uncharacterized protein YbaR (Trm112 family)
MHTRLLQYLCDPVDQSGLSLSPDTKVVDDRVETGELISDTGHRYPIVNGVPRFLPDAETVKSVESFGDEWNFFNYDRFKVNWLTHIAKGVLGSGDYFTDRVIVEGGAGGCLPSRWRADAGAKHG